MNQKKDFQIDYDTKTNEKKIYTIHIHETRAKLKEQVDFTVRQFFGTKITNECKFDQFSTQNECSMLFF